MDKGYLVTLQTVLLRAWDEERYTILLIYIFNLISVNYRAGHRDVTRAVPWSVGETGGQTQQNPGNPVIKYCRAHRLFFSISMKFASSFIRNFDMGKVALLLEVQIDSKKVQFCVLIVFQKTPRGGFGLSSVTRSIISDYKYTSIKPFWATFRRKRELKGKNASKKEFHNFKR